MGVDVKHIRKITEDLRGDARQLPITLQVFIDTRQKVEDGLFVPIIGERHDGHQFLMDAVKAGAVAALWAKDHAVPEGLAPDFPLFLVDDTLIALQQLAALYRHEIDPVVIGVTGSNGKTTTKDIIAAVLASVYNTHKTSGNLNNHIGLPLTLLRMPADCQVCVLEMGMNHFGEISLLSRLAEPDIAVITNIGESHIEFLGSRKGIATAKLEIIDGLKSGGLLIIDGDEPLLSHIREKDINIKMCGYGAENDWQITKAVPSADGMAFTLNNRAYNIPLLGRHNVKNAVYALAVASKLNISEDKARAALRSVQITGMRLETMRGKHGSFIINDAYNASPTSMKAALETLSSVPGYSRKIAVLGDMYELGPDEQALHESVAQWVSKPITDLVTVGEKGSWIAKAMNRENAVSVKSFKTKEEALPYLESLIGPDTAFLFKASMLLKLGALADALAEEDKR